MARYMRVTSALALLCVLASLGGVASQTLSCVPVARGAADPALAVGDVSTARSLPPLGCDYWELSPQSIQADASCDLDPTSNSPGYLLFEFWRLDSGAVEQPDPRPLTNVFFMVAKGVAPNVTLPRNGNEVLSPGRWNGFSGTQLDDQGDRYSRTYHQVFMARNGDSSRPGTPGANSWFVTVANMERQLSVYNYKIRVTCLPSAAPVPCPSPAPSQPPCSGRGTCVPALPNFSYLRKTCQCQEGWGDYDCWRSVPLLANGATATAVMQPNSWAFWQVRVPLPPAGGVTAAASLPRPRPPALLVELNRGGAAGAIVQQGTGLPGSGAGGGDPVLLVMPKSQSGSNQVPWFLDVTENADLQSYFMQQALHYLLLRDPQQFLAAPFTSADNRTADFYVAVYNNNQRFSSSQQANQVANITLRVRWTDLMTAAAAPPNGTTPSPPLCPGNCFGRGTCFDPRDPASTGRLPPPQLPPRPAANVTIAITTANKPTDFQCACTGDAGGTMCEGVLVRANVTRATGYSSSPNLPMTPGQWRYVVVQMDNTTFDYRYQQLSIKWTMRDSSPANASAYVNAFLSINEQAFPRDSDFGSNIPFQRGWQIFYSSLASRSNPPTPLLVRGADLTPGLSYVFGLYNSDYLRQVPYTTNLTVEPMAPSPPPQPPRPPRPARAIPPQPPGPDWWWWVAAPPPTEGEEHGGSGGEVRRPPPVRARRLPPGWRYHAEGPGGAAGSSRQQKRSPPAIRVVSGSRRDGGRAAPPPAGRRRGGKSGGR